MYTILFISLLIVVILMSTLCMYRSTYYERFREEITVEPVGLPESNECNPVNEANYKKKIIELERAMDTDRSDCNAFKISSEKKLQNIVEETKKMSAEELQAAKDVATDCNGNLTSCRKDYSAEQNKYNKCFQQLSFVEPTILSARKCCDDERLKADACNVKLGECTNTLNQKLSELAVMTNKANVFESQVNQHISTIKGLNNTVLDLMKQIKR